MKSPTAGAPSAHIAYRPDIDGLRAIAVTAVVLYHAALPGLPGGFVGVDIFFVISGFLIGGQIFREGREGRFSYAEFYARRARRILPAFLTLLAICYVVGVLALTPMELKEFGKEAFAAVLAASNILFYSGGGYFAPDADRNPLLMTWSLGVEEQFYIIFPLILLLLLRQRIVSPLWGIVLLSILSFAGSLVLMHVQPTAAFYLLPTRAWELGIGAALAVAGIARGEPLRLRGPLGNAVALGALLLLGIAIAAYTPDIAFPGWYVLLPTVATGALILTPGTIVNRTLLGNPAMQFIGKISYSWYLWHWPVFYLNRILEAPQGGWHGVMLVLVTLLLAVLSWRFVETPLRRRVLPQRTVLWRYALACLLVALPGAALYKSGGWIGRLLDPAEAMALDARTSQEGICLARYGATRFRNVQTCLPPKGPESMLAVLGDSHADAISHGFRKRAEVAGLTTAVLTKSSCAPLLGYALKMDGRPEHHGECIDYQARAFAAVARRPDIHVVVLAGYWRQLLASPLIGKDGSESTLEAALGASVDYLRARGKTVVLVQDVPSFEADPYALVIGAQMPARVALASVLSGTKATGTLALPETDPSRTVIKRLAQKPGVVLWDPHRMLCQELKCAVAGEGLYYSDAQHLTIAGAIAATKALNIGAINH
ncbi:MAG: acyltransferase family protein [Sphingobium sp.]